MSSQYQRKNASSELDYGIDWSVWLAGDTIATNEWIVPTGITEESSGFSSTLAVIELSGGTPGETYPIKSKITTALGREECAPMYIKITDLVC